MKVGILTFHFSDNFGAVLQAYALQNVIKQMGYECEIINYRPPNMPDDKRHLFYINTSSPYMFFRSMIGCMLHFPLNVRYQYRWGKFRKDCFCLSEEIHGETERINNLGYDCFVVGSDQVWNERITGSESGYLLEWAKEGIRKISYAASLGEKKNLEFVDTTQERKLKDFHFLSVREDYAKEFLVSKIKKEIAVLPDPTLLLKETDMKISKQSPMRERYLFLYIVTVTPLVRQVAYMIAEKRGLKVVDIGDRVFPIRKGKKHIHDAGPWEFINLIYYADVVVTSSFHGTIFSLLFHKQFYSVPGSVSGGRISNLCKKLGVESSVIYKLSDLERDKPDIDYEKLELKLAEIRNNALHWIRNAIDKN